MNILYTATATASGGREGSVRSSDGILDLPLSMPKELDGSGRAATNPEQLFAAGYAACFENALLRAAREGKVAIGNSTVTASVGIGRKENGRFGLAVDLQGRFPASRGRRPRRWPGWRTTRSAPIPTRRAATSP